eukprot:629163-Amorphochlora_amoeboformis.AAC.2
MPVLKQFSYSPKVVAVSLSQDKLNGVLREGAVRKRGELNRRYKERYMKLEKVHGRSFLVYYKNKGEEKHSGTVNLTSITIEATPPISRRPPIIHIRYYTI